ncbi:hypothetical protein P9705_001254 [Enterococcus faecalis]|nr:hypothetical protein [Enterococcus faecalis]
MNNNEKILHILNTYDDYRPKFDDYLEKLKQRYDWSAKQRADYTELVMNFNNVRTTIKRLKRNKQKNMDLYNATQKELEKYINALEDEGGYNEQLDELLQMFKRRDYKYKVIHDAEDKVIGNAILKSMLDQLAQTDMLFVSDEDIDNFIKYLNFYTQGLQYFKQIDKQEMIADFKILSEWCEENDIDNSEIEYMIDVISIEEECPEKDGREELLQILSEIRIPEAKIKRGYTVLDYYQPFLKALIHLRRVIRESREYLSVKNALGRYDVAVEKLRDYYESTYHQAGGIPTNHKDGKRLRMQAKKNN